MQSVSGPAIGKSGFLLKGRKYDRYYSSFGLLVRVISLLSIVHHQSIIIKYPPIQILHRKNQWKNAGYVVITWGEIPPGPPRLFHPSNDAHATKRLGGAFNLFRVPDKNMNNCEDVFWLIWDSQQHPNHVNTTKFEPWDHFLQQAKNIPSLDKSHLYLLFFK